MQWVFLISTVQGNKIRHKGRFWCDEMSLDEQITQMQEHIERYPHLNESFEKVAISFINGWQVLVPEVFCKEEREEELLEFNAFLKARTPLKKK